MKHYFLYASFIFLSFCKTRDSEMQSNQSSALGVWSPFEIDDMNQVVVTIDLSSETLDTATLHKSRGGYACQDSAPYGLIRKIEFKWNSRSQSSMQKTYSLNNAGLRVKGNTSCDVDLRQKSFKLHAGPTDRVFLDTSGTEVGRTTRVYKRNKNNVSYSKEDRERIQDQTFGGYSSLILRKGTVDNTGLRDQISNHVFAYGGEIFRKLSLPGAPLKGGWSVGGTSARIRFVDGGRTLLEDIYTLTESLEETAFDLRFGKDVIEHQFKLGEAKANFKKGSLLASDLDRTFKAYDPQRIDGKGVDDGAEWKAKKDLCDSGKIDASVCEKSTKQRDKAFKVLSRFVDELESANLGTEEERRKSFQKLIDVDQVLTYLAGVNLTGHWDSLVGNANNDYLVYDSKTKLWSVFAWDLDNTFGAGGKDFVWMAGIDDFGVSLKHRPLFGPVLELFRDRYIQILNMYLDGVYEFDASNRKIMDLRDKISSNDRSERFELLFKFKNHRFANVYCQLRVNPSFKARIKDGWPVVNSVSGKSIPECQT